MFTHILSITSSEADRLRDHHYTLIEKLNNGKSLHYDYINSLVKEMQGILLNQDGLKPFWQQAATDTTKPQYLHLVHSDKELLNLPWQMAVDPIKFPFIYVSKGLAQHAPAAIHEPQAGPLKILVMISSPEDLDITHRLSYEAEEDTILKALGTLWEGGQVQVDFTDHGSLSSLREKLQAGYYHMLYVTGHGVYRNNAGYLILENADTLQSEYVSANDFAAVVKNNIPALVVLASCQTAHGDNMEGFTGVSDELINAGIPAVIAMAFSISDVFATIFANHLFGRLADRCTLPEAYGEALKAMQQEERRFLQSQGQTFAPSQWLIPQLYCTREVKDIVSWTSQTDYILYSSDKLIGEEQFILQIPHKNYRFIGRRKESARIFKHLLNKEAVLLRGQGGVGKTVMAEYLVRRLISHNVRFQCFAFNETAIGLNAMIGAIQHWLKQEKSQYHIQSETDKFEKAVHKLGFLMKRLQQFCDPIWVFDNMESCQADIGGKLKAEYEEWMDYVQKNLLGFFPVIFTGRYPVIELPSLIDLSLNQVSFVDYYRKCLQLELRSIRQFAPQFRINGIAHLLYSRLGGNYRLLEVFDEIYKNNKGRAVQLIGQLELLTATIHEELATHNRKLVFAELVRLLSEQERYTIGLLAHFMRPIISEGLILQDKTIDFARALKRLNALTLVEEQPIAGHIYYYITPLVRDWLQHESLPAIKFSHQSAGHHYEHSNKRIQEGYYDDLHEAFGHYVKAGSIDQVIAVSFQLTEFYFKRSLLRKALQIALQVEQMAGTRTTEPIYNTLGMLYRVFGQYELALKYLEKSDSDDIAKKCKQRIESALDHRAMVQNNIAQVYYDMGNFDQALSYWQLSVNIQKELGNFRKVSDILLNVCDVHLRRGEIKKAIELAEENTDTRVAIKDFTLDEKTLNTTFRIHRLQGDYENALECLKHNLSMQKDSGNRLGEANIQNNYAIAYIDLGFYEKALECLHEALPVAQNIGDPVLEANILMNFGEIFSNQGKWNEAFDSFDICLEKQRAIGDRANECIALINLSKAFKAKANYDKAFELLDKSESLSGSLRDRRGKAIVLKNRAIIYYSQGQYRKARSLLKSSLSIVKDLDDKWEMADVFMELAAVAEAREDVGHLYKYANWAYQIFRRLQNARGIYRTGWMLGEFHCSRRYNRESVETGLNYLKDSLKIGEMAGFPGTERIVRVIAKANGNI